MNNLQQYSIQNIVDNNVIVDNIKLNSNIDIIINNSKKILLNLNNINDIKNEYNNLNNIKKKLLKDIDNIDYLLYKLTNKLNNHDGKNNEQKKIISFNTLSIDLPINKYNSIYWNNNLDGLYLNVCDNNIELTLLKFSPDKKYTIDCKHGHRKKCRNTNCSFIHIGEEYLRQSNIQKPFGNKTLGSIEKIDKDICSITYDDIKKILLYCIPDILIVYLWFKYNNIINKVIKKEEYTIRQ